MWVFKDAWLLTFAKSYLLSHLISSHNHKVAEGPRRLSCPQDKQGHIVQFAWDHLHMGFYLQEVRLHSLPGQPVSVKTCLLMLGGNLLFQFMPIASGLVTGHCWKEPALSHTPSLVQYLYTLIRSPWAFLPPRKRVSALLCRRDASVSSSP